MRPISVPRPVRWRLRRGASLVEAAFVLNVLLIVLFGMLDLALMGLHHNSLAEIARMVAREATVRGMNAPPARIAWGPEIYLGNAADETEIAEMVRAMSTPTDLENLAIRVEWPDGDHDQDDRVRVEVSYSYAPILPFIFGSGSCPLTAVSIMRVTH